MGLQNEAESDRAYNCNTASREGSVEMRARREKTAEKTPQSESRSDDNVVSRRTKNDEIEEPAADLCRLSGSQCQIASRI